MGPGRCVGARLRAILGSNEELGREFAAFHGLPYAVAVYNGAVALELGLRALGVGSGTPGLA